MTRPADQKGAQSFRMNLGPDEARRREQMILLIPVILSNPDMTAKDFATNHLPGSPLEGKIQNVARRFTDAREWLGMPRRAQRRVVKYEQLVRACAQVEGLTTPTKEQLRSNGFKFYDELEAAKERRRKRRQQREREAQEREERKAREVEELEARVAKKMEKPSLDQLLDGILEYLHTTDATEIRIRRTGEVSILRPEWKPIREKG